MKGSALLQKIEVRNFTPTTDGGDYVERKKNTKKEIFDKIPNIEELKQKTMRKIIS